MGVFISEAVGCGSWLEAGGWGLEVEALRKTHDYSEATKRATRVLPPVSGPQPTVCELSGLDSRRAQFASP
jgi:hypothetical protein